MKGVLLACPSLDHGLGNRMRLLLSARLLARREARYFAYAWPRGAAFRASLDDLWRFPERRVPARLSAALARRFPYRDETAQWIEGAEDSWLWQIMTGREVATGGQGDWQRDFRDLVPSDEVAERVVGLFTEPLTSAPFVGVMIRANAVSHAETRTHSPVSWYLGRMREVLDRSPDTRFFLSCDDAEVQQLVQREFPSVVSQTDKGPYNSRQAVVAAVVDLYLLAASSYVLGPHRSSFIHLATYLSGGSVPLETAVTGPRDWWTAGDRRLASDALRPWDRAPRA